ncbi:MAG: pyroglutamyl-peptidase I [Cryobacterium sp.]
MTSILLTGFEPFDGETINPSWQAVLRAQALWDGPERLHVAEIPVDFEAGDRSLARALARFSPDLVIAVGQAGGRSGISVERVAINVDDARIPDNAGFQPVDAVIVAGGPAAYFSTLPIKSCVAALAEAGIPASVSQTAGTYACNHLFYRLMHSLSAEHPAARGGFVHVPFAPEQVAGRDQPSMSVDLVTAALLAIMRTSLDVTTDARIPGGALH